MDSTAPCPFTVLFKYYFAFDVGLDKVKVFDVGNKGNQNMLAFFNREHCFVMIINWTYNSTKDCHAILEQIFNVHVRVL